MKNTQYIHLAMLFIALILTATLLPLGWFAAFWSYLGFLYMLIWSINHKEDNKWVKLVVKLF